MNRPGRATVKHLAAGVRLEDLSEWLTETRLAVVGLRRVDKDIIAPATLPGERMLLLTLDRETSPEPRSGSARILIESSERGEERWARVTAHAKAARGPFCPEGAPSIVCALGVALRRAMRDVQTGGRAEGS